MIWRLGRQPRLLAQGSTWTTAPLVPFSEVRAFSTTFTLGSPSIASVLALPPLTEGHDPHDITISASVRTVRNQKKRSFVELGDGSTIHSLQAVLEPSQCHG